MSDICHVDTIIFSHNKRTALLKAEQQGLGMTSLQSIASPVICLFQRLCAWAAGMSAVFWRLAHDNCVQSPQPKAVPVSLQLRGGLIGESLLLCANCWRCAWVVHLRKVFDLLTPVCYADHFRIL